MKPLLTDTIERNIIVTIIERIFDKFNDLVLNNTDFSETTLKSIIEIVRILSTE